MVKSDIDTYCNLASACEQTHGKHTEKTHIENWPTKQANKIPQKSKNRRHGKGKDIPMSGKKRVQASPGAHALEGHALSLPSCHFFPAIR